MDDIIQGLKKIWGHIKEFLVDAWDAIKDWATDVANRVLEFIEDTIDFFKDFLYTTYIGAKRIGGGIVRLTYKVFIEDRKTGKTKVGDITFVDINDRDVPQNVKERLRNQRDAEVTDILTKKRGR